MCRKKKRVIHPRYHSPCQTPYTALRSLLSVALSSGMVKSNLIIPFISDKVNVQPFRRHCSVISDEGVQFKTARVFNSTAIFICPPSTLITCVKLVLLSSVIVILSVLTPFLQRISSTYFPLSSFEILPAAITSKSGHNLLRSMATFGTQPPTALDTLQIWVSSPSFGYYDTIFITSAGILPATAIPFISISYTPQLRVLPIPLSKIAYPAMWE